MFPVVFSLGNFAIHSYGLLLAVSFLVGIWLASARAKKSGLDASVIPDLGFWLIIAAILGARLYYVGLHFDEFQGDLSSIFNPFHDGSIGIGGLVMYGGVIGALLAGIIFFKLKGLPFLPYADAVAPTFALGEFFTRIGCFLNGCCYGMPTHNHLGVSFPIDSPAGQYQLAMHASALFPSQLFLSFGGLFVAAIVIIASLKKTFDGFAFYLVMALYAVLRFAVDYTRYYAPGETYMNLSHNQWLCIVIFALMTGLIAFGFAKMKKTKTDLSV